MFAKFMNKKDFHPGSKANIKRVWMAEQKSLSEKTKQKELDMQYKKEQDRYQNRQLISKDDKLKSGLGFLYEAPPGYDKDKEPKKEEEELRFEWQKGAPREKYAKDLNLAIRDQPFGIPVRNVKCIRCGKWGHVNTDRECPLLNKNSVANYDPTTFADVADPAKLMEDMRNDGLALKQAVLGRSFDPRDPNQQILASEGEEEDPEAEFLASLTDKQKRKLLRKLDKLEKKEQEAEDPKKHKKKKKKKSRSRELDSDESDEERSAKRRRARQRLSSSSDLEADARRSKKVSRHEKETKRKGKKRDTYDSESDNEREPRDRSLRSKRHTSSHRTDPDSVDERGHRKKYKHEKERKEMRNKRESTDSECGGERDRGGSVNRKKHQRSHSKHESLLDKSCGDRRTLSDDYYEKGESKKKEKEGQANSREGRERERERDRDMKTRTVKEKRRTCSVSDSDSEDDRKERRKYCR